MKKLIFMVTIMLLCLGCGKDVYAAELADGDVEKGIYYTAPMKLTEEEKAFINEAFTLLDEKGFSEASACGIIGNIFVEDRQLNPLAGSSYHGYFQMSGNQWYSCQNKYGTSLENQIDFVVDEKLEQDFLTYTDMTLEDFKKLEDPQQAAEYFCVAYERAVGTTGHLDGNAYNGNAYQKLELRKKWASAIYYYIVM